jgi:hypothetical protein
MSDLFSESDQNENGRDEFTDAEARVSNISSFLRGVFLRCRTSDAQSRA